MSKGIFSAIAGGLLLAAGIFLAVVAPYALPALATFLITSGSGLVLSGIGTLLQGTGSISQQSGLSFATRNPIAPWTVVYGRARVGGNFVFINEFGDKNKYLDVILVLASHACEAVDALYFDQQRIQIGANNTSFTPLQQNIDIVSISRSGVVVTVVLGEDIPLLSDGDQVLIENVTSDLTMNGKFPVTVISHIAGITFTYLCGGLDGSFSGEGNCKTQWRDAGTKVYMEALLGTQTLGQTFAGMILGTPKDGDPGSLVQNPQNPWTAYHSLVGKTAVFLRFEYDAKYFSTGLPQISFLVRGKNDVYDPRSSPASYGYTENAALCIADYLSNSTFGFKSAYGTEIPLAPLIAAANICDEAVDLAVPESSTEPRYTCNGIFPLTMKRSEVLQNLLTSCAGRLTYEGGQWKIWPAAWQGLAATLDSDFIPSKATASYRWRSTVSISGLFNGVKGTYVSPVNGWQPSDFPRYAQDEEHGYDSDANLAADGGERRWLDIQLPFTISHATAQRIAKIELLRRRHQGTGTFPLNMAGYRFTPMDVLSVTLGYFGWADQYLEILATRFKLDQQQTQGGGDAVAVVLGVEIDVQETDPSIYEWSIGEELSPQGYQQAIVPDNHKPSPPTNVRITSSREGRVTLSWDPPQDAYVLHGGHLEAEYQVVASPAGLWISLGKIEPTVTEIPIPGILPGILYYVRIRSVNAAGVPSDWVSIAGDTLAVIPLGQWAPHQAQAPSDDALFPNEFNFELSQSSSSNADGTAQAFANVTGKMPVKAFIPDCPRVVILRASVTVSPTGGLIPGGITVYLAVGVRDAEGEPAPPSVVIAIDVPSGTDTNSIEIADVEWPDFAGLAEYVVYASDKADLVCEQDSGGLSPSSPLGSYTPGTVTFLGPLARSTSALPDSDTAKVRLKYKPLIHGGVEGAAVDAVGGVSSSPVSSPPGVNFILASQCADAALTDDWTGRKIAIIGRENGAAPWVAFDVLSFDPATGLFILDQDPVAAGVLEGDALVVCTKGVDNSGDRFVVSDPGLANAQDKPTPHAGLVPHDPDLLHAIFRVIAGTSRGKTAKVVDNDATSFTLDTGIEIDDTSVWIIEGSTWFPSADFSAALANSDRDQQASLALPTINYLKTSVLVAGFTVDSDEVESTDDDGPIRMLYLFGATGSGGDSLGATRYVVPVTF